MSNNLEQCYKVLGLESGASLEEVNQAYKDLAFIWHPDRLPKDNTRLIEKSAAKLKEINQARDILRDSYRNGVSTKAKPNNKSNKTNTRSRSTTAGRKTSTTKQPHYAYERRSPAAYKTKSDPPNSSQQYARSSRESKNKYQSSSQDNCKRPYHKDMVDADLRNANLKEKDFSGRNFTRANLSGADLSDSFLHKINLDEANLQGANLHRANLLGANLKNANLKEANLIGADLSGADLSGADLSGAIVSKGKRIMVKLTGVKLTGATLPDGSKHS